jgi:hypothetical protein
MALALHIGSPRVAGALVCSCLCIATLGCLYTGRINGRPSVSIPTPGGHVARGQTVAVSAYGSDPDGDLLTYGWWVVSGDCGAPPTDGTSPTAITAPPYMFTLPRDAQSTTCVWVRVTDTSGAVSDFQSTSFTADNRPPVAVIDVQVPSATNKAGTYYLYTVFRLGAGHSTDPDGDPIVSRTWTLVSSPPQIPPGAFVACAQTSPEDLVQCLDTGNLSGVYVVSLVVNDGLADSAPVQVTLTVDPDHLPCVSQTDPSPAASPIVWDPSQPREFKVLTVLDDGAPYPPVQGPGERYAPTFAWSLRRNGGAWQDLAGFQSLNDVTLPADSFVSGDNVDVRVVVSDGQSHTDVKCDDACPAGCPGMVTWTVEYL